MKIIKLFLVIGLAGYGYNYWQNNYSGNQTGTSDYGFVTLPKPSNLDTDTVIILAAKNCTKEAAQKAEHLADELRLRKIPYTRASSISFQNYDRSLKKNLDSVMGGPMPHVLIDGRGKANPTLNDVVAEYNSIYE
ncbi:MAG: hypothetical protein OEZ68_22355 [Gammaproteobacteria bacterium]|nr:hypothetical protein [Gammaproteobacteria bacterium]MDH5803531.1 hypothetical protein [Gammaproteobacteria bacterium]